MSDKKRLSPKRAAFVRALLTEKDTRNAARVAGIAESTAYRWIKDSDIHSAILEAEGDVLNDVTRALLRLANEAVDTLDGVMTDESTSPNARIRAADIVLSRLLQLRELVTLEERIAELEAKQNAVRVPYY